MWNAVSKKAGEFSLEDKKNYDYKMPKEKFFLRKCSLVNFAQACQSDSVLSPSKFSLQSDGFR